MRRVIGSWSDVAKSQGELSPEWRWTWPGLVWSWPIATNVVLGQDPTVVGPSPVRDANVTGVVSRYGYGAKSTASGSASQVMISTTGNGGFFSRIPVDEVTVLIIYEKNDGTNRVTGGFGIASTTQTDRIGAHMPFSDGNIYWDFGGASAGTSRVSTSMSYTANVPAVWVLTAGARGMDIWKDGILQASHTGTVPTRTNTAVSGFGLFQFFSTNTSDLATCYGFAGWNYQMSPAQIRILSRDPAGMWRRDFSAAGGIAAAAAGTNLAWKLAAARPSLAGVGGLAG